MFVLNKVACYGKSDSQREDTALLLIWMLVDFHDGHE